MFKVFYFVLTLTNGQQMEPIFAVAGDCKVASEFAARQYPAADVTLCATKWVKK